MFTQSPQKGAYIMPENFYIFDTFLNIYTFCFIGFLVWLYLKKEPEDQESKNHKSEQPKS
jgi:hypothetical protein